MDHLKGTTMKLILTILLLSTSLFAAKLYDIRTSNILGLISLESDAFVIIPSNHPYRVQIEQRTYAIICDTNACRTTAIECIKRKYKTQGVTYILVK